MTPKQSRRWALLVLLSCVLAGQAAGQATGAPPPQAKRPLSSSDIDDIATLLKLEDTRQFDETALGRIVQSAHPEVRRRAVVSIGRIVNAKGSALLDAARKDADPEIVASVAFALGQLKDNNAVPWLEGLLDAKTPAAIGREAAQALGKIQTPEAQAALGRYLAAATSSAATDAVIGEALLSMGRYRAGADIAPIVKWMTSPNVEVRWRATWALFRPADPKAVPHLLKLSDDPSAEVRYWAVRTLLPARVDQAGLDRKTTSAKLLAATKDQDRRVRTEALRALLQYDDDNAFGALVEGLASTDTWISSSAAENAGRFAQTRGEELKPKLIAAGASTKPLWIRNLVLTPLVTLAPETALEVATSLARSGVAVARTSAVGALGRLGDAGRARHEELSSDPALKGILPALGGGRGAAGRGAAAAASATPTPTPTATPFPPPVTPTPTPQARPDAEYRALVEKWIVPDYNGRPKPRAIWETARGTIELELRPGDAPFGVEYFLQSVTSGDIVGTEFGRVVPNFVDQQQTIRNAPRLRDEVNRHGLLRGTLAWASSGLDTGRAGYTLGSTPQPHNEGNFTALGRVVSGMNVVDTIEWGDKITAARMK